MLKPQLYEVIKMNKPRYNRYLCNQLGNALFCVTSGIFLSRCARPAKSHELHKIAFPNVLHIGFAISIETPPVD
jgi:hypothetical protein